VSGWKLNVLNVEQVGKWFVYAVFDAVSHVVIASHQWSFLCRSSAQVCDRRYMHLLIYRVHTSYIDLIASHTLLPLCMLPVYIRTPAYMEHSNLNMVILTGTRRYGKLIGEWSYISRWSSLYLWTLILYPGWALINIRHRVRENFNSIWHRSHCHHLLASLIFECQDILAISGALFQADGRVALQASKLHPPGSCLEFFRCLLIFFRIAPLHCGICWNWRRSVITCLELWHSTCGEIFAVGGAVFQVNGGVSLRSFTLSVCTFPWFNACLGADNVQSIASNFAASTWWRCDSDEYLISSVALRNEHK